MIPSPYQESDVLQQQDDEINMKNIRSHQVEEIENTAMEYHLK